MLGMLMPFSKRPRLGPVHGPAAFRDCFPLGHTSGKVIMTEGGHLIPLTHYCSIAAHGIH